jgi:hypothetical protein
MKTPRDCWQSIYENACYAVDLPEGRQVLRIDERNESLRGMLQRHGAESAIFLTASNPHSVLLNETENADRSERLEQELRARHHRYFIGTSGCPDARWPEEKSFLILGITADEAQGWLENHQQNACLLIDREGQVSLRFNTSLASD